LNANNRHRFGQAFLDFLRGDKDATLVMWRDDGLVEALPVGYFFRTAAEFSPLEQTALSLCRGRVLDWEAGAGSNSLELQCRGCKVASLASSPQAHEVLLERGLLEAHLGTPAAFDDGSFDTVLQLGHGIGIVGELGQLDEILGQARRLLRPGGQFLVNSRNVQQDESPLYQIYQLLNQKWGRYPGEVRLELEYQGQRGDPFSWFHIDTATLQDHAAKANMKFSLLQQDSRGNYLARLERAESNRPRS
jgi:SAM-dependent methyltransferase